MATATVKNGQIPVPENLLEQAGLKDGDAVIVEAVASHMLHVRPATAEEADAELMRFLATPFDLSVIEPLTRAAIYEAQVKSPSARGEH